MCKMQLNKRNRYVITKVGILFAILIGAFILMSSSVYAAMDETEPNDDMPQANTIKVGETVYGKVMNAVLDAEDIDDYYKFTAPVSGTIKVTVYSDSSQVRFEAWDVNSKMLNKGEDYYDTPAGAVMEFPVICGETYYIHFSTWYDCYPDYHFTVGYSIGKTSIKSVKGKKKAFTVKWDKKAKASFYEVQYVRKSVYSDYNWTKAKTIKVSRKLRSKTISKLKKNKKYYVRVRVARTIEGVTYYSNWSPKKLVRTK